jgi:tRNA A58 N-methylase Trm61
VTRSGTVVLTPQAAWQRVRDMESVLARQPAAARAVGCLPLFDQLELTLELLRQSAWPDVGAVEELPPNVIRFRPRLR